MTLALKNFFPSFLWLFWPSCCAYKCCRLRDMFMHVFLVRLHEFKSHFYRNSSPEIICYLVYLSL